MKTMAFFVAYAFAAFAALAEDASPAAEPQAGAREPGEVQPLKYYGKIAQRVALMLPAKHVLQHPMDDEISRRAWTNLVSFYDFQRSIFLKSDIERMAERESSLDDELKAGDASFGFDLYNLYCKRLRERIDYVTNALATAEWDFSTNETYQVKRKTAPWPESEEEANDLWRRKMKFEMLAQTVGRELDAEKKTKDGGEALPSGAADVSDEIDALGEGDPSLSPKENLLKKYRQYVALLTEPDEESVMQRYMTAVCQAYDPHSDYMSPVSKEDFDMEMSLSLCGVGATLQMDDGALKIAEILPGGPLDVDGRIEEGDKIVGVAQGDGPMEDILWHPIKKSIKKIRGAKGTRVTLEIVPRSDPTGAVRKRYEIVRDVIRLDEGMAATGRVEKVVSGGVTNTLGYIYLPGFYGTPEKRPSDPGFRSSAMDVGRILAEFNAQDVEGVVLDLRGDGGGLLREAVMLSAHFVPSGPVVQTREMFVGLKQLPIPAGNPVAFKKPVVVMTDRASASASEIVAAHLRDTARAVVVGDARTHGKGTVQNVMGMGPERYGSIKITTGRFYRVDGRSTQVKGVEADIHLPSVLDSLDIGEDKLDNALPFTRIVPAKYEKCWNMDEYIPKLKELSDARLKENERYAKHLSLVAATKEKFDRETVPLEHDAYMAMVRADRQLDEPDAGAEAKEESGEARPEGGEAKAADEDGKKDEKPRRRSRRNRMQPREDDVVLDEALNVLADLVRLNGGAELPKPPPSALDWYNALFGL